MSRLPAIVFIIAVALALAPAADAATAHKRASASKPLVTRSHKGYGFLPGVRPPRIVARDRLVRYWRKGPHYYGPAVPRFHHGRWNGGGFGPCYTQTPIGYMWTCGR